MAQEFTTLSVPAIRVNNDLIAIVPNSFKYKSGDGEIKVRAGSTGGGGAKAVHSQDAEMMYSSVVFRIFPTINNIEILRTWKAGIAANTIDVLQEGVSKDLALAFKNMSLTNDPDVEGGADTDIEMMFAGDKLA